MQGQLYINNKDAWTTWKVKLDDGYDNLKLPANPKEYVSNDSRSQSGKQVFIDNPQPQSKDVQLVFAFTGNSSDEYLENFDAFIEEIVGVITLKVMALKTIYKLRVTDYINLSSGTGLIDGRLSVRFSEDNPSDRQSTLVTATALTTQSDLLTDDSDNILTNDIK